MKIKLIVVILILVNISNISGKERFLSMSGNIYRSGTDRGDLLFRQEEYVIGDNINGIIEHKYYSADNNLAAFESVTLLDGRIGRYETKIREIGFSGLIEIDGEYLIVTRNIENRVRTRKIRNKDNVIVGPMLPQFIKDNLPILKEGEVVDFHLPYFDFLTLVPLEMKMIEGRDRANDLLSVEMTLKSAFLSLFIDPIEFLIDGETGEVQEIHGQTILPESGYGNPRKMVYAEIYYTHVERL